MKNNRNNLDEMQEQKLLHIEHNGVWLTFWGLLAAILIQMAVYGAEIKAILGEWIVFMCLALYLGIDCLRNGIWDRKLRPEPKMNLGISFIAGLLCGAVFFFISYKNYGHLIGSICTGVFMLLFTFVLCIIALSVSTSIYKKRLHELENKADEDSRLGDGEK